MLQYGVNKLRKYIASSWKVCKKELKSHAPFYLLLAAILLGALFVRTYRTDQVLGFYYDQGRDAKEVWELWHEGDFFLIGPTTGIAGIFRGPFYFYLIAPFYLLSGGNPVLPSYFLSLTSVLALIVMYCLAKKIQDRTTGLFAVIIGGFSFYLMLASRWLSNPTPMLLLSMLLVWAMFAAIDNKKYAWPAIGLISGLSLFHFGSSGEFFYFPALLVLFFWMLKKHGFRGKSSINLSTVGIAGVLFLFTASPLILFDFLHEHILSNNITGFLFGEGSFKSSFGDVIAHRLNFYHGTLGTKIFPWLKVRENVLLAIATLSFLVHLPKLIKNDYIRTLLLLMLSPVIGLLFFQGNFGNIYDYYLTGYYLVFILLFSISLGLIWKHKVGKLFVIFFIYVFFSTNLLLVKSNITTGVDGENTILLGNQKQAVDWVFEDAAGRPFNVDVYVPPVIPHAYDYLFLWRGEAIYNTQPEAEQVELLYTLEEVDPSHPERLREWYDRQSGIGSIEETVRFGGITVERRTRFPNDDSN